VDEVGRRAALTLSAAARRRGADMGGAPSGVEREPREREGKSSENLRREEKSERKKRLAPLRRHFPSPFLRGARRTPRREPSTRERPTRDSEKLSFVHADGRDDHRNRLSRE
jgi:hypothetical protein